MRENATLHFDLSHLAPDQQFTLHAGLERYPLQRHTPQTLAGARRENAALRLVRDDRVTHYAQPARLPSDAVVLLRVTAPPRDPDDPLDRLALVSIYLPRRHRAAAVRARQRRLHGAPMPLHPKLAALRGPGAGVRDDPDLPDDVLIDIHDITTAQDCAAALVFHHGELMTLVADKAAYIIENIVFFAKGMTPLANSILSQAQDHEHNGAPNWVNLKPGTDWATGQPTRPVWVWSDDTLALLVQPLQDTLRMSKDDTALENWCWTVLPGITQVPLPLAPPAAGAAGGEATYTITPVTPQGGVSQTFGFDPSSAKATVSLGNTLLRWLQVNVDQYGPGGEQVGTTARLGLLSPPDTVMAVPLPTDPTDFTFTFDEKASSALVTMGGLGQAPFSWRYDGDGIGCTILFNFAIPTVFIAMGVAVDQNSQEWSDLQKSIVPKILATLEVGAGGPLATLVGGGDVDLHTIMLMIANIAGSLMLAALTGSEELAEYITEAAGQEAAEAAEPFLGWASLAIGAAADTAAILETTVAVASNPAQMTLRIERVVDVTVSVQGDHQHQHQWPATATDYTISITYADGPVYAFESPFDPRTQGTNPITHTFTGLPAGGSFTVLATFVAKTGWLAGSGCSPSQTFPPDVSTFAVPMFEIKENLVPLTATTTYTFDEKLTYGASGHVWSEPPGVPAPTATVSSLSPDNTQPVIGALGQITLNENLSTLAYSWQAADQGVPLVGTGNQPYTGQEHTFQAISDATPTPEKELSFCTHAYVAPACLAFPPPTMPNPPAAGFLLEPQTSTPVVMHLRELPLIPGEPLVPASRLSFGCFAGLQDDLVIHPSGYAVALCTATSKLQVVRLAVPPVPDADAPQAVILAGQGTRPGLMQNPVAVSCSLDRIVVLDSTDDDPQGVLTVFDVQANPVYCFAGSGPTSGKVSRVPLRSEESAVTVVDLAVEPKNYLYVLKYLAPQSGPVTADDYRLDIYNPDGSFLTQVPGLAAAALHVDLWRNTFTLNYEIVAGSGRTEPSVSRWIPSTPDAVDMASPRPGRPPGRYRGDTPRDGRRGGHR